MVPYPLVTIPAGPTAISLLPDGKKDIQIRGLILQPTGGNSNPIYVGGPDVTSTIYGWRINAPTGGVPPAPFQIVCEHGLGNLGQIYIIGTAGESLHVTVIG